MGRFISVVVFMLSGVALARPAAPKFKQLSNPNAPQGGTVYLNLAKEPTTLNPITSTDLFSDIVQGWIVDTLMTRDLDTYEWVPNIAESWKISKDGKEYTFTIRKGAKFQDGTPITADDVKFSFDVIFDSTYNALPQRPYYEGIAKAEVLDPYTVRFTAKTKYWGNFDSLGYLKILPKHVYGNAERGKKMNHTIVASGPYMLESYDVGNRLVLKRNPNWWGNNVPYFKGYNNFNRIIYRFISDSSIQLESLKKHEIDFLDDQTVTPEEFVQKAVGPEWGKTAIKEKVQNSSPKSYSFIGWNLLNPIFKDRNVRIAMTHLMNRRLMIQKFLFNMAVPATGPWHYQSPYASPRVKPLEYNPKLAIQMLKKAGWSDADHDGILSKVINGKKTKFIFTLLYANADREKYYTLYKEDLKRAGIDMELKLIEWNTFIRLVDEKKFDAIAMGWGGGAVDIDPKQIWSSESMGSGGSNFISYSNPEVDKLIEKARDEINRSKRIKILQKVYELIAADQPYTFMFNEKYVLYMHTPRIKMPRKTFKFDLGTATWWLQN